MELLRVAAVAAGMALLGLFVVASRRENTPAATNIAAALAVTLVPPALGTVVGVEAGIPALTLLTGAAGICHGLGMLGYYESLGWWDHLTHTLSAALASSLLYAWLLLSGVDGPRLAAWTVLIVLAFGVLWEIGELFARDVARRYDIEPVLVHYGPADTALDLTFDVLGAALVVALDARLFVPTIEAVARALFGA